VTEREPLGGEEGAHPSSSSLGQATPVAAAIARASRRNTVIAASRARSTDSGSAVGCGSAASRSRCAAVSFALHCFGPMPGIGWFASAHSSYR
jgi:hypothetical protein